MGDEILLRLVSKEDMFKFKSISMKEARELIDNGGAMIHEKHTVWFKIDGYLHRLMDDDLEEFYVSLVDFDEEEMQEFPFSAKEIKEYYDNRYNNKRVNTYKNNYESKVSKINRERDVYESHFEGTDEDTARTRWAMYGI